MGRWGDLNFECIALNSFELRKLRTIEPLNFGFSQCPDLKIEPSNKPELFNK